MATTIQVQSGGPGVNVRNETPPSNLKCMKGLAITQLIIGILSVIIGIAVVASLYANSWVRNSGAGIWAGLWICITGILGIIFTLKWKNGVLSGCYLTFSILSTILAFITTIFYIIASAWYAVTAGCYGEFYWENQQLKYRASDCSYRNVGTGLHVFLMLLMMLEFIISIVASCCSCKNGCCNNQTGVIVQPVAVVGTSQQPVYYQQQPQQPYAGQQQYSGQPQYAGQQQYPPGQYPPEKQGYNGQGDPAPAYVEPYPGV